MGKEKEKVIRENRWVRTEEELKKKREEGETKILEKIMERIEEREKEERKRKIEESSCI